MLLFTHIVYLALTLRIYLRFFSIFLWYMQFPRDFFCVLGGFDRIAAAYWNVSAY